MWLYLASCSILHCHWKVSSHSDISRSRSSDEIEPLLNHHDWTFSIRAFCTFVVLYCAELSLTCHNFLHTYWDSYQPKFQCRYVLEDLHEQQYICSSWWSIASACISQPMYPKCSYLFNCHYLLIQLWFINLKYQCSEAAAFLSHLLLHQLTVSWIETQTSLSNTLLRTVKYWDV